MRFVGRRWRYFTSSGYRLGLLVAVLILLPLPIAGVGGDAAVWLLRIVGAAFAIEVLRTRHEM